MKVKVLGKRFQSWSSLMLNAFWCELQLLRGIGLVHKQLRPAFYCRISEVEDEIVPPERYRIVYAKLIKLSYVLKEVEHIDGKITNVVDDSIINNARCNQQMQNFISLTRLLIGAPHMQQSLKESSACAPLLVDGCFSNTSQRKPMRLDSLTKVCDFLGISAQQRKNIRLTVCPQLTQHHIWRGALEEVLAEFNREIDNLNYHSPEFQMAKQVIASCLKFLEDTGRLPDRSPPWMRPAPLKQVKAEPTRKWEEVLEMFVHMSRCMDQKERSLCNVAKVEAMKEGLYQIRDIVIERDISFKEARRQDSLVQKKLTKSLGHSSNCLFTLLLYYLHGSVRDLDVEVRGGICGERGKFYLHIGKVLTNDDERMVRNGVKQLSRALGLFKFVWESASMGGALKLNGHLWCVEAKERTITYRGNEFFVHDIRP
ncbi:hypothetical protein HPP92_000752 [Vanilla planifolia]|uniref:Uncharacterized protein n=1 Tax=Vanilla planifolia TaxID=51239 RepID=A0A835VKS0_VANPL|nr:hypothetical protein HPP92_000752 [Vanilla planifolia]